MSGRIAALGALVVLACAPARPVGGEAGTDVPVPPGAVPPGPPTPRALPAEVETALAHTDDGRTILLSTGAAGPEGTDIQLVYDEDAEDPITRWGQCLGRVVACYEANEGGPIAGCMTLVERCASDDGGEGCCPGPCLDAFAAAIAGGMEEDAAVDTILVGGDCVPGLTALRERTLEVIP